MDLKPNKYTYKEWLKFKEDFKTNRNINFLLDNLEGLRTLGYELYLNKPLARKHAYHDVVKIKPSLKPLTAKLIKKRGTNGNNN